MNDPSAYSTRRDEAIISGPSAEERAAAIELEAEQMRESDTKVRWALLEECVKQNIDNQIAVDLSFPGVDHFFVNDLGEIESSGIYTSLAEYVTLKTLEIQTALNPVTPPHATTEQKVRSFTVQREVTIHELHAQMNHYASINDQRNYRRVYNEIAAM